MLTFFRRHKKSLIGYCLVGLVAILMFGFGVTGFLNPPETNKVATVDDIELSYQEFDNQYRRLSTLYRNQFGEQFDRISSQLNLGQRVLDSMIDAVLVQRFTNQWDLLIGVDAILAEIRSHEFFAATGVTQEAYRRFTRSYYGMSIPQYEDIKKKEFLQNQINSLLTNVSPITEPELKTLFQEEEATFEFQYVEFDAKDFEDKVTIDDEEKLIAFYEDSKELYRKPKSVRYTFVKFDPKDFEDSVEIDEDELRQIYHGRTNEFQEPTKYHLRKIFFAGREQKKAKKASPLADLIGVEEEQEDSGLISGGSIRNVKRETAEQTLQKLDDGEDFQKLARELSDDKRTGPKGGELGWLAKKAAPLSAEEKKAAFALEIGQYSKVIETKAGFSIFYLEDIQERRTKLFEEVKGILTAEIKKADASLYAQDQAGKFIQDWKKLPPDQENDEENSLASFAKTSGVTAHSTDGLLGAGNDPANATPGLTIKVLPLDEAAQQLINLKNFSYIVHVDQVKESYIPEIADVRDKVISQFKRQESETLGKEAANALLAKLIPTPLDDTVSAAVGVPASVQGVSAMTGPPEAVAGILSLAEASKQVNREVQKTEPATKREVSGTVFAAPNARQVAFTLSKEKPLVNNVLQVGEKFFILELLNKKAPEESVFAEKKEEIRIRERSRTQNRLYQALINTLRENAKIEISDSFKNRQF